jgi:NAD(P)-dependent dehydrogenase (short-subunit alcohol dehydrogenase family)
MTTVSRSRGSVRYDNSHRVVLVTGGGQGIGYAIAQAFHTSGARVVVVDVNQSIAPQLPQGVAFKHADTSRQANCERVVLETVKELGGLDVLVNNAAIQPPESYAPVDQLDDELHERMVDINLKGYTYMAKYALRQMKEQGSGVVVNMASEQGHRTTRGVPVYGPIKAANILQARQWAVEYARDGIRVVSVSPGAIRTPLVEASLQQQGGESELANRHPLGRIGRPEEVACAVMWLASGDASFITATDLAVDGGLGGLGAFADPYPQ